MLQQKTKPIVVGVAGGTASGKSTFCSALQQRLPQGRVVVLQLDSYYRCRADIRPSKRGQLNYDHPNALDFELMVGQLHELCNGGSAQVPVYDFSTHTRDAKTVEVSSAQIILVEGILALYWKSEGAIRLEDISGSTRRSTTPSTHCSRHIRTWPNAGVGHSPMEYYCPTNGRRVLHADQAIL